MISMTKKIPIVCLVGPTGAGKTAASTNLSQTFSGGVVNLDSRQVYRDFPIITAQPTPEEQSVCPHKLYGFLRTEDKIDAGKFIDMASDAIYQTRDEGLLPLLVGGTGLYLKALLEGLAQIPRIDQSYTDDAEAEMLERGSVAMHEELVEIDPEYAAKIHENDRQRICRALAVFRATNHTFSWWHKQPMTPTPFRGIRLGIDVTLEELTPLLALRIDLMLEAGAIQEAEAALVHNDDPKSFGWSGIGCAELYQYITGKISMDECKALWLKNTRAYAKRQLTWFRKDKEIIWVKPKDFETMNREVRRFLTD